jgi:predicted oxidoreductase
MTLPILGTMRLGRWGANLSAQQLNRFFHDARAFGIDTIDTADIYGDHSTNALIGAALALSPDLRAELKIIAKAGIVMPISPGNGIAKQYYNNSSVYLQQSLEQSLRDFAVAQVDQFLVHRIDLLMDCDALCEFAATSIAAGKIRAFGLSNASSSELAAFDGKHAICANQLSLSLGELHPMDNLLVNCQARGAQVQAYSPLKLPDSVDLEAQLALMATARNLSTAQLQIAWLTMIPSVSPVIGSTQIHRVADLVAACQVKLSREEWYRLYIAARGKDLP